ARIILGGPHITLVNSAYRNEIRRGVSGRAHKAMHQAREMFDVLVAGDGEEAIFLADRLMVLSNRPAKVRKVIDIDLPRPRDFHLLTSKEFLNYKRDALEILYEEAMKAFASGSRVAVADFIEAYAEVEGKSDPKSKGSL
ncbi:MAG: hypothetical protein NTY64_21995, partial [Deltaproteobacteria bacterium]|nr:hypothetical protein [Deltaproteobacteria bacterium]